MIKKISAVSLALVFSASLAIAMDKNHSNMNHDSMTNESKGMQKMEQRPTKAMDMNHCNMNDDSMTNGSKGMQKMEQRHTKAMDKKHSKMKNDSMNNGSKGMQKMEQRPTKAMDKKHSKMNDDSMNNGSKGMQKMEQQYTEAMGKGVIHSVSKLNRVVNITHAPIADLNWPEMKMDIAVAKDVDLNDIKPGDKVEFHIVLDDDKVYRIHHFE
ncbi:MAG: hypothetical protein COA36_02190 [Desulfotalea sp.]|nr:MAG: hypothetical protein COA36_02190 [Desulfotalea sp.]